MNMGTRVEEHFGVIKRNINIGGKLNIWTFSKFRKYFLIHRLNN